MSVRFAKVTLKAPKGKAALGSIDVCAVLARSLSEKHEYEPISFAIDGVIRRAG
jgi:hypothetical protein